MESSSIVRFPRRIADLIDVKAAGADVRLDIAFEILPVEFRHRRHPFQAYIFLAKYCGTIEGRGFDFRKCYARGCPNNLCTHVSQAVKIANRYLQRDYHVLKSGGIEVTETLFSLEDMIVKFETLKEEEPSHLTIPELTAMAKSGKSITVDITLELIPAVEHFSHSDKARTYLSGEFTANTVDRTYHCHRCFACFDTDQDGEQKETAIRVANTRLALVYSEFEKSGIQHRTTYFS
ncbi:MAG: hypothetical protein PVI54_00535 [Desulfobacteraceae bacterium]|jgi:hypothetical protein